MCALAGSGAIVGNVRNAGRLEVGGSGAAGLLVIAGDYVIDSVSDIGEAVIEGLCELFVAREVHWRIAAELGGVAGRAEIGVGATVQPVLLREEVRA